MRAILLLLLLSACSWQEYKDTSDCAYYPYASERYCHEWWNDGSTFNTPGTVQKS
jgi:hypothetical protein